MQPEVPEPVIYRDEVIAMLFNIAHIKASVKRIEDLLTEYLNGEEGPEDIS